MIALVDCNNFYVSCERALDPALKSRPVVVLSNNDGVIISRSNEVKAMGIPMAAPVHKYKDIIKRNNVAVFSANFGYYMTMSEKVNQVVREYSPEVEMYSVDEAFLSLEGMEWKGLRRYMKEMHDHIMTKVDLPVSVGIARTKTLTKVASELVKKDPTSDGIGLMTEQADIDAKLRKLPVGDIWGIGPRTTEFLTSKAVNIHTAFDLKSAPEEWVRKNLHVTGLRTVMELRGLPCINVETVQEAPKSVMRSRSFGKYITSLSEMREAVSFFASAVGEVLRSENCVADHIGVFFNTNRFNKDDKHFGSKGTRLSEPTASSQILIRYALELLEKEWEDGYRYNKAGVVATGITRAKSLQLELGHSERIERGLRAITTVDTLNSKYHHNLISLASQGTGFNWRSKQENLSSAPQEYIRPTQRYRFMPYVPMSVGKSVL